MVDDTVRRKLTRAAGAGLALALAGAAAVPVVTAAPPAQARVDNGAIAFSGTRGATRVVYARHPANRRARIVPTPGRSGEPAFSPLGRRVAFTRFTPGGGAIWITYLDGKGRRQLTTGPADGMAAWAPSGEELVFARGRRGRRDIYRVVADGTGLRRLTLYRGDDHSPAWSSRNQVAFVRRLGRRETVQVMPASGGPGRRLTRGRAHEAFPDWSPTGRTLVVARGRPGRRDLYVVRAEGGRPRRLTRVRGDESEPAWSPDGSRIAFVHRHGRSRRLYIMKARGRAISKLPTRSRRVRRLASGRANSASPSWQLADGDPVVAAAGDIACDPLSTNFNAGLGVPGACRQRLTSDLLLRMDLSGVLLPGDVQYEDAALWKFQQSFHPTWGRLKHLIHPVPGNHEYRDPAAAGFFDYFNGPGNHSGPAGERDKGYYSFDVGSWHVVALNSQCAFAGGCELGSAQEQWLRADLAAHPARCTLAYWHEPRFTSGRHSAESELLPLWNALYEGGADVLLNGHEHFYERFAPQTPAGAPDPQRGIRQLTVGMGGRSRHGFVGVAANSEVRDRLTIGVLKLTLSEGAYAWELVRAPTGRRADSGSGACH